MVDLNFADAPYFLECEYGGEDLAAWAAEDDHLAGMDTPARVALFLQIASAVAAAHSVGVLHKDLKPANVLIDADGAGGWVARLTDFGISRVLDPARLAKLGVTAMGMTVTSGHASQSAAGTPLCLAPELLARQPPTMRSDLYALGLIFYQLLVGDFRRPIAIGWEREIDDELLREDIAAATQGRPEKRLASVAELVDRLDRLTPRREAKAALAQAELALVAWRRARERRPWVIASFAGLLVGLVTSLWFYGRADRALGEVRLQASRTQAMSDFMNVDVLQSVDPTAMAAGNPGSLIDVLNFASSRAADRFTDDPLTEATVRLQLGDTYARNLQLERSIDEYRHAATILAPRVAEGDARLIQARLKLAGALANGAHLAEAQALLDQADKAAPPDLFLRPSEVAVDHARAHFKVDYFKQAFASAIEHGRRLVQLVDQLDAKEYRRRFVARMNLADACTRVDKNAEAEAVMTQAVSAPISPDNVGEALFARGQVQLGVARFLIGNHPEVEAQLLAAQATLLRRIGPNDYYVGVVNETLASLYEARGDYVRQQQMLEATQATYLSAVGPDNPSTHVASAGIAVAKLNQGKARSALDGLAIERAWFVAHQGGERSAEVQSVDFSIGRALNDLGRFDQALRTLEPVDAERVAEAEGGKDWPGRLEAEKARAVMGLGRRVEGTARLRRALSDMQGHDAPKLVPARYESLMSAPASPLH